MSDSTPSQSSRKSKAPKPRVLCVDDEEFILEGIASNLRKSFKITTAKSGQEALELIEQEETFPIIISDMRMPGMDGAQFLKQARQVSPDSIRILLTGHADLEAAISVVNEGKIFRYLTKPCPVKELKTILEEAVGQYQKKQVQRDVLMQTLRGSVQVLTEVLGLINPVAFSRGCRIQRIVEVMAEHLELTDIWEFEVAAMLSQLGCVTLHPDTLNKVGSGHPLEQDETELYESHPAITRDLIKTVPRMESIAEMIAHQLDDFPTQELSGDIRLEDRNVVGSQLLRIAIDFDQLTFSGLEKSEAEAELQQNAGAYDPRLLACLTQIEIPEPPRVERFATLDELAIGMIFEEAVLSKAGVALVSAGSEVNFTLIDRLKRFSDDVGLEEPFKVTVLL